MSDITIIDHSDRVEDILGSYREVIGEDYRAYRGHVYRTITYAMHFLGGAQEHRAKVDRHLKAEASIRSKRRHM